MWGRGGGYIQTIVCLMNYFWHVTDFINLKNGIRDTQAVGCIKQQLKDYEAHFKSLIIHKVDPLENMSQVNLC